MADAAAAAAAAAEAAARAAYEKVATDLLNIWDEKKVPMAARMTLAVSGCLDLSLFAQLGESREKVREVCSRHLGLGADNLAGIMSQAALVSAWESARKFVDVRHEVEAEARALRQPVQIIKNDHLNMRRQYEDSNGGELEDRHVPGHSYVESQFEQCTEGEYKAESLKEVFSIQEDDDNVEGLTIDRATGHLKMRRKPQQGHFPKDSEELRDKYTLMTICRAYTKARFPSRRFLERVTPNIYRQLVAYILGEDVAKLESKDQNGHSLGFPSWELVLEYEYQIRKKAAKLLALGRETHLEEALKAAIDDQTLRGKHFLTPWQVTRPTRSGRKDRSRSRSRSKGRSSQKKKPQGQRRGAAAKGGSGGGKNRKNKGSGKGGDGGSRLPQAPAGMKRLFNDRQKKQICFTYNLAGQSCSPSCNRSHVCWWCTEKHEGHKCPKFLAAK
jgi:hypothetical protein